MKIHEGNIIKPGKITFNYCPYCYSQLSKGQQIKRKILKYYRCAKCGKTIDERNVKY